MYVRVTNYALKPGSREAATALLQSLKSEIMGLPGAKQFINAVATDGSGCVISIAESQQMAEANRPAIKAIWEKFSEHLLSVSEEKGYDDIIANWTNT